MSKSVQLTAALALALMLPGCSGEAPEPSVASNEALNEFRAPVAGAPQPVNVNASAAAAATAARAPEGGRSEFTTLDDCRVLERTSEEGGWRREACPGVGGFALELTEGDLRQNLIVLRPGGVGESLALPSVGGSGGFSEIGPRAEWRGRAGEPLEPTTLTVRFNVAERQPPVPDTSYLVVARLNPAACVIAAIPPGPGQSARARTVADAQPPAACMKRPN